MVLLRIKRPHFLQDHIGEQQLFHQFDIAFIIGRAKHQHAFENFTDTKRSTLPFYKTLQPMSRYADYLFAIKCVSNRSPVRRFRTGCRGLQVDTDRWANNIDVSTGRGCLVCKSLGCVEDEQHFTFDCPAYSMLEPSMWTFFSIVVLLQMYCYRLHVFVWT